MSKQHPKKVVPFSRHPPVRKVGSMQKVVCCLCSAIFKVRMMPPPEIVRAAGVFDDGTPDNPYQHSALPLNGGAAAAAYCREHCVVCNPDSPWFEGNDAGDEPADDEG